jgi:hypothetical protein
MDLVSDWVNTLYFSSIVFYCILHRK